jgi:hypothetical protein
MEAESAYGSGGGFDPFASKGDWEVAQEAGRQSGGGLPPGLQIRIAAPIAEPPICRHTYVTWRSEHEA